MNGPFMTAIAKHLDKELDGDFLNYDKIKTTLNVTLPLLQVTAATVLYKDEFVKAYQAISSIRAEQLLGVFKYCKLALSKLKKDLVVSSEPWIQNALWLEVAYAIDKEGLLKLLGGSDEAAEAIRKLAKAMEDAQSRAAAKNLPGAKNSSSYINELFVNGISKFGVKLDEITNEDLLDIVANDKFLTAMVIAQDIGEVGTKNSDSIIDALRRFRCLSGPNECSMGGVPQGKDGMLEFFGFFEKLADAQLAGKIDEAAWGSLSKVITAMGPVVKEGTNIAVVKGTAKGATSNFAEIALQLEESGAKLIAAENKIAIKVGDKIVGSHVFDHVLSIENVVKRREVKEWEPEEIADNIWNYYFNGKGTIQRGPNMGKDKAAGQFYLDVLDLLQKGAYDDLTKVDIEWAFVKGNPADIISDFVRKVVQDKSRIKSIMLASGNSELIGLLGKGEEHKLNRFLNVRFVRLLKTMIVNTKNI
jgi:hypothetical protein